MRHVGLILLPIALLAAGCRHNAADPSPSLDGVEAQLAVTAPYGTTLPDAVRDSTAARLQRALIAKGWPDVTFDVSAPPQVILRIPSAVGSKTEKAIRDVQALETVPPLQLVSLINVCYRSPEGVCGSLMANVEYLGAGRFRELGTHRLMTDAEVIGSLPRGPFRGTPVLTGADLVPGSVSVKPVASSTAPRVAFQIRQETYADWEFASHGLLGLMIAGRFVCVLAPRRRDFPGPADSIVGRISMRSADGDSTTVSITLPSTTSAREAKALAKGLEAATVPPPPIGIHVLACGLRQDIGRFGESNQWRRRRRWVHVSYTIGQTAEGRPVTQVQCRDAVRALETRAALRGGESHLTAKGTKEISGWIRIGRGFRRPPDPMAYSRISSGADWSVLRLRPHGVATGRWVPEFRDGWVDWRSANGGLISHVCRVDEFARYLRADPRNTLMNSSGVVPSSAFATTDAVDDGGSMSVDIELKPAALANWKANAASDPKAGVAMFLDGVLIAANEIGHMPLNGDRLSLVHGRLLSFPDGSAPSGLALTESDAQLLADTLNLPPIPVSIVATSYTPAEIDPANPPWGRGGATPARAGRFGDRMR